MENYTKYFLRGSWPDCAFLLPDAQHRGGILHYIFFGCFQCPIRPLNAQIWTKNLAAFSTEKISNLRVYSIGSYNISYEVLNCMPAMYRVAENVTTETT